MKKIPTLFERVFENHRKVDILDKVPPNLEWVLQGDGIATIKMDGSCCAIIEGEFYKRYDAKKGKKVPKNAIRCQDEPDPVTGHLPCWVPVSREEPGDKWFCAAFDNSGEELSSGTYEAIGPHFQANPYGLEKDILIKHGSQNIEVDRSFEGVKEYLRTHAIEGIVFWKADEPRCKIKRTDFGFKWPVTEEDCVE